MPHYYGSQISIKAGYLRTSLCRFAGLDGHKSCVRHYGTHMEGAWSRRALISK